MKRPFPGWGDYEIASLSTCHKRGWSGGALNTKILGSLVSHVRELYHLHTALTAV